LPAAAFINFGESPPDFSAAAASSFFFRSHSLTRATKSVICFHKHSIVEPEYVLVHAKINHAY
jgi:hypothetical protein